MQNTKQNILPKIVDTREPAIIRNPLLVLGWSQRKLAVGDYLFMSYNELTIGITRKTIDDLLSSIISNFAEQLYEMQYVFPVKIILLEGNWKRMPHNNKIITNSPGKKYDWNFCWNFLRTWQDREFTIEITTSATHTIERLESLYNYYQKPIHKGGLK